MIFNYISIVFKQFLFTKIFETAHLPYFESDSIADSDASAASNGGK